MKSMLTLMFLLSLSTLSQAGDETIYDKNLRCGATFPEKPTYSKAEGNEMWLLSDKADTYAYLAMFSKLDDKLDVKDAAAVKKRFDAMMTNAKKNLSATLVQNKEETFGPKKWPARYIEFKMADGVYLTRWVLTNDRVAQVVVMGTKQWVSGEEPKKFLQSMKVED